MDMTTDEQLHQKFTQLAEPFPPEDLEWRMQGKPFQKDSGWRCRAVTYITNRAVMDRLDKVFGPNNWRNEYRESQNYKDGFLCGISIRIDGEWITKWDGANATDVEPFKGGISDSMKRAAVQWGIGRYLYKLDMAYVPCSEKGFIKPSDYPRLPDWALPKGYIYPSSNGNGGGSNGNGTSKPAAAKPAAPKAEVKPEAAQAPAAEAKTAAGTDSKALERARAYTVPVGFPEAGKTLGDLLDTSKPELANRILRILAGKTEGMKLSKAFEPQTDEENKVRLAAAYILEHTLPVAA